MQSLRLLGRAVPKSALRTSSSRCYSALARSTARPSWLSVKKASYPAFSTSTIRREATGEDQVLAAKLEDEHRLENESTSQSAKDAVEEFKASGIWEVVDKIATNEILLQRTYNNETIKVEFSIEDMTAEVDDGYEMDEEDRALADEDFPQPKRTINQSGAKGGPIDVAPEDSIAPSDRDGEYEEPGMNYPVHLDITITKPGTERVEMRAIAEPSTGIITVESIQHLSTETDSSDDNCTPYTGPPFQNLDPELQGMFDQYLHERGINENLVMALPTLIDEKEQREYIGWLDRMQKFIEA